MKRIIVVAAAGAAVALGTMPAMAATAQPSTKVQNNCVDANGVSYTWNGPAATSIKKIIASIPALVTYFDAHQGQYAALQAFVQGGCNF